VSDCLIYAGATCSNESKLVSIVPGSQWISSGGVWILVGCPAGYYLNSVPECRFCPAAFYCPGVNYPPAPCGGSLYSMPGASTVTACVSVVYIVVTVNVRVLRPEFDDTTAGLLETALSEASGLAANYIFVKSVEQSTSGASTTSISNIATYDALQASIIAQRLNPLRVKEALLSAGLEGTLSSVQSTACIPGYMLSSLRSCDICPAGGFCLGGISESQPCSAGQFALPGARSPTDCFSVVFVVLVVGLPITADRFNATTSYGLRAAVAQVAAVPLETVMIAATGLAIQANTRRIGPESLLRINVQIAANDSYSANTISSAISTANLPARMGSYGLSGASLLSITVVGAQTASSNSPWEIVAAVLGACAVLSCAMFAFSWRRQTESKDESELRKAVARLLVRLHVTPEEGYVLSSMRTPLSLRLRGRTIKVVQRSYAEAAARLWLLKVVFPDANDTLL
jgi:hypothetical protein